MRKKIVRKTLNISDSLLAHHFHPILTRVYGNRGVQSAKELELELKNLLPYQTLYQMDLAVDRLVRAIKNQEKILILGDYDVDGATSTALMLRILRAFGAESVDFLIPNRFVYGYGLSPKIVELAACQKPDLLITVDNGISSVEGVEAANDLKIDIIVTDHHLAPPTLPRALAIINPNQPQDHFLSKNLAGVGVVFYIMLALRAKLRELNWFQEKGMQEPNLADYLDLVALGTVADMVSLDRNNRILVAHGLRRIRAAQCCPGITALLQIARRSQPDLAASDLGYSVGPRLNAAGRLEEMSLGVNCLLADDFAKALHFANELEKLNEERRGIEHTMRQEALSIIHEYHIQNDKALPFGVCLMNERWHQGVVGIIASRIKDRLHRPTIVFAKLDDGSLKGSGRSVPKLHLRDAIEKIAMTHPDLILRFGGHAMAAGLTIVEHGFSQFSTLFDEAVRRSLNEEDFFCEYETDGALDHEHFDLDFAQMLREAGPWGQDFSEPVFDGRFHVLDQRLVGNRHLKLTLEYQSKQLDAIAFNVDLDQWPNHRCEFIEAVYRLDINSFRGRQNVQLVIEYLEPV